MSWKTGRQDTSRTRALTGPYMPLGALLQSGPVYSPTVLAAMQGGNAFNVIGLRKHVKRLHSCSAISQVVQEPQVPRQSRGTTGDIHQARHSHESERLERGGVAPRARRVQHGDIGPYALGQVALYQALDFAGAKLAIAHPQGRRLLYGQQCRLAMHFHAVYGLTGRCQTQRNGPTPTVEVEDNLMPLESSRSLHERV